MNQEQKALYAQAQLAGLGLVVAGVGFLTGHPWLPWIGGFILVFGLARFFLIRKLIQKSRESVDDPDDTDTGKTGGETM